MHNWRQIQRQGLARQLAALIRFGHDLAAADIDGRRSQQAFADFDLALTLVWRVRIEVVIHLAQRTMLPGHHSLAFIELWLIDVVRWPQQPGVRNLAGRRGLVGAQSGVVVLPQPRIWVDSELVSLVGAFGARTLPSHGVETFLVHLSELAVSNY